MHVDLTLAVNYLPACACLGKVLVFMLMVSTIPPQQEVDGFVILAAMLYVDRLVTRNIIFDANAILLAIFFANVNAGVRALSTRMAYRVLVDGLFLCWACGSLVLLSEPLVLRRTLEKRPAAARLVPILLMLLIVVAMSHVYEPLEPGGARCCRAVAFALLAFAWIYIVGVRTHTGIEYLKENSCQFVARLSPVLYAPQWIAVIFTLVGVAVFVMLHMRPSESRPSLPPEPEMEPETEPEPVVVVVSAAPAPETDLEEIFRMARQQQQARSRPGLTLDSIHENA